MKRTLLVAAGVLLATLGLTTAASAQTYPPPSTGATINDSTPTPGQPVTVAFAGFDPNTSVTGVLNSAPIPLGTQTANASGSVSFIFTVPSTFAPGETHTVTATGTRNGAPVTFSASFTVAGAQGTTAATTTLPRTGDDSSLPLTQVGTALLAVGGGAMYMAKRRRSAAA